MGFLERLSSYMKDNNIKQSDILKRNKKLSKSYVSMACNGSRQPNTEFLNTLSDMSGKTINWWLHGREEYDNLYSLNELIDFFIEKGDIKKDGTYDKSTAEILKTMLDKEIRVKLSNMKK